MARREGFLTTTGDANVTRNDRRIIHKSGSSKTLKIHSPVGEHGVVHSFRNNHSAAVSLDPGAGVVLDGASAGTPYSLPAASTLEIISDGSAVWQTVEKYTTA